MAKTIKEMASGYAECVKMSLTARPIEGVNPTIVSNGHRMGYEKGANEALNAIETILDDSNWLLRGRTLKRMLKERIQTLRGEDDADKARE